MRRLHLGTRPESTETPPGAPACAFLPGFLIFSQSIFWFRARRHPRFVEAGLQPGSLSRHSPLLARHRKNKASSLGIPGIESLNAKPGVVSNVAGDDCKAMFHGSCGDHAVRRVERRPLQLTPTIQYAPPISYGTSNRQDASFKPRQQIIFKPPLQLAAPLARRKNDQSSPQFANRHNA